jgi:MFS transporter, putative metabolite:H+ symporter
MSITNIASAGLHKNTGDQTATLDQQAQGRAAAILARLDRLPGTRHMWTMITLLSLGGMFEFYDLFMTAYVVPGLMKAGLLTNVSVSIFAGPALFVAATFTGLFIGTFVFGYAADKYGRRTIFTYSMLWYSAATVVMACQDTGLGVSLWRLIAGIGIGVELVTIDTYISELVPKTMRGRAFAFNQGVQFAVVPIVAFIAYKLVPISPFGVEGWRWVVLIGSTGALIVWFIRRSVPESPRWLINQGRLDEADTVTRAIEAKIERDLNGAPLPQPGSHSVEKIEPVGRLAEAFAPAYRGRTLMLMTFQFFQTFGFYGFAAWVPTLIAQQTGINVATSLLYSFIIAIANPFGPWFAMIFADKVERKWQLVAAACGIGIFGMLFSFQTTMPLLILFGVLITLSNNVLSYAFHNYQAELFPARIRARAVGFTYSLSRLSAIFASFIIGFFLQTAGTKGVFGLIAVAMIIVVIAISLWGPRTLNRELEEISV